MSRKILYYGSSLTYEIVDNIKTIYGRDGEVVARIVLTKKTEFPFKPNKTKNNKSNKTKNK